MSEHEQHEIHPEDGYEKSDINVKAVLTATFVGVILIVASLVGMSEYFISQREQQYAESVLKPESSVIRDLRAKEMEILTSYKVIDVKAGVYQIPVSEAMRILAEQGNTKLIKDTKSGKTAKK